MTEQEIKNTLRSYIVDLEDGTPFLAVALHFQEAFPWMEKKELVGYEKELLEEGLPYYQVKELCRLYRYLYPEDEEEEERRTASSCDEAGCCESD